MLYSNLIFTLFAAVMMLFASSRAQTPSTTFGPNKELRVAFIYPTAISDFGFTYSNEIARVSVERTLQQAGYNISTVFTASVAPANAAAVLESYIKDGYQMLIATGGQFASAVLSVASRYPDVKFVSTAGLTPKDNVAVGFPRNWEASYMLGYGCALVSSSKQLGFVAAFSNNNVHTRAFNAFYIGAKAADPSVNVTLATVNSFLDAITEEKAAVALMNQTRADCIASMVNDNTVNTVTAGRSVFSAGYASDARLTSGEFVLSSNTFDWSPYFTYWIEHAYNGTWVPNEVLYWGFAEGVLNLAPFGTKTSATVKRAIATELNRIKSVAGGFNPFCGNYALQWNASGSCLSVADINKMNQPITGIDFKFNFTLDSVLIREFVDYSSAASIVSIVWVVIFLVLLIVSVIDLVIYRDTIAYRTSSPLFCGFIAVGICLIYISTFGWIGYPTAALCAIRPWLAGLGFALIYGCVLAKNWRVFRIFSDDSFKVFAITNFDLIVKWLVPVVGIEIVILTLWQALDPLQPVQLPSPVAADTRLLFCSSKSSAGLIVLLAYKGILLIAGSALSYLTRRITSDFRESMLIALSVYNAIVIGLIVIVVNLISSNNVLVQYIITVFGILIIASVTHGLIFFPKFFRIHVTKDIREWSNSTHSNKTNSTNGSMAMTASGTGGRVGRGSSQKKSSPVHSEVTK